ncbi:hypothetical protein [Cryobacterium sp. Y82]|uniref:Eco57I restriction-modification methylase domain-containing protein n=1 Tax=Cryobacterium sp. Y82 TaxID=2045017 RepID=UPI000CE42563|nr:hypothetical protein [Cryobacterium sp. Y82]
MDDLILSEVSTFDDAATEALALKTVIITCESEDLEWLSYKPDFPDSIFHITIYDGVKSEFAARVYSLLKKFEWNLRILNDRQRVEPYEKSKSSATRGSGPSLTPSASNLLESLATKIGVGLDLASLSDDDRLNLIAEVCEFLHHSSEVEPAGYHPTEFATDPVARYAGQDAISGQDAFWSTKEVNAFSPGLLSLPDERESAMFLTPPELAYDIAAAAAVFVDVKEPVRFGDPAVGPGIFFASLRRLLSLISFESAEGVEINPDRAHATGKRWRRAGLKVIVGDFLTQLPPKNLWTLLLANPPYVRHQDIDRPLAWLRESLYKRTGIRIDGRSDLYMYFILTAHDWLAEHAIAAWLLPSELVATDYGRALRGYLTTVVRLRRLHIYDGSSPLFDNARISSAVIIYERFAAGVGDTVEISRGGTLLNPLETLTLPMSSLRERPKWNWATLQAPVQLDSERTIGDYFDIKRGIATGANALFVLGESDLELYGVWPEWVRSLLPKSRWLTSSVVEADAAGGPLVVPRMWLIDTSEDLDSIRAKSSRFARYLEMIQEEVGARTLVSQRRPIYRQEVRTAPTFVFMYMAKSDVSGARRFVWNKSNAVVLNSYLGMTPKPEFAAKLQADSGLMQRVHSALGGVSSSELQRHGRTYVSGLLKLEPKELARVRVNLEFLVE